MSATNPQEMRRYLQDGIDFANEEYEVTYDVAIHDFAESFLGFQLSEIVAKYGRVLRVEAKETGDSIDCASVAAAIALRYDLGLRHGAQTTLGDHATLVVKANRDLAAAQACAAIRPAADLPFFYFGAAVATFALADSLAASTS
jgi:hypothetical protein